MKKRASFILVLPVLAVSCGVRSEPNEKPKPVEANPSAVVEPVIKVTTNPPTSTSQPASAPDDTGALINIDARTNPPGSVPVKLPEPIIYKNPPPKPPVIHKNPPAPKHEKDETANPF